MRIRNNGSASRSYRSYRVNTGALNKNLEKLSSGYKINRAGDDAAGLSISEKMRAQITGLSGAQRNVKEGIGLIQTTEGALEEYHRILNRMLELSEQSANGTYDATDRALLQQEMSNLAQELNRIADTTNFNGIHTLNLQDEQAQLQGVLSEDLAQSYIASKGEVEATLFWNRPQDDFDLHCITPNGQHICWNIRRADGGILDAVSGSDNSGPYDGQVININGEEWTGEHIYFSKAVAGGVYKFFAHAWTDSPPAGDSTVVLRMKCGNTVQAVTLNTASDINNTYPSGAPAYSSSTSPNGYSKVFQIVADESTSLLGGDSSEDDSGDNNDAIRLLIGETGEKCNILAVPRFNMHTDALGLAQVNIMTQRDAVRAASKIKEAVNQVSSVRGTYGALQNRLEHTVNYLGNAQENIQDAESVIRDTDMAQEMMKYTKNSVLTQSAQSMLAQANMLPEGAMRFFQ